MVRDAASADRHDRWLPDRTVRRRRCRGRALGIRDRLHRRSTASSCPMGSPQARMARSGSPIAATTRSGGSRPAASSVATRASASTLPTGITAGPDGALWFTNSGNDSIGRITVAGVVTNFTTSASRPRAGSPRGRTALCGSPTRAIRLDRADHDRRQRHHTTATRASAPRRNHGGARRRPVVHEPATTTRSGGSPWAARSRPIPGPGIADPYRITVGAGRRALVHEHGRMTRSGESRPAEP